MPNNLDIPIKAMIVDDDRKNRQRLEKALMNGFHTTSVEYGEKCLKTIDAAVPELILLDVSMAGLDGHELCRKIRKNPATKGTSIIFISDSSELDDKIKGYDAGGDDYIAKPIETIELIAKLKSTINTRREYAKQLSISNKMVYTAMTNTSEYGVINEFVGASFEAADQHTLGHILLQSLTSFDLKCCIQIRGFNSTNECATNNLPVKPLESKLMSSLMNSDRIHAFNNRLTLNFQRISLLVKNMPMDDPEKYGRYRDHLALMMNVAEARVENLNSYQENEEEVLSKVSTAIMDVNLSLSVIEQDISKHSDSTTGIIDSLLSNINKSFSALALTLEQEEYFVDLVSSHMEKVISLYQDTHSIDHQLKSIGNTLRNILSK